MRKLRPSRRLAFVVGALVALFVAAQPSPTALYHVWYSGRPDEDVGTFPRVSRARFMFDQRHHRCALVVEHIETENYGVVSHLCEWWPSPTPVPLLGAESGAS